MAGVGGEELDVLVLDRPGQLSRVGRTIARSALRTPTPSTEQKISKNSRSITERNPDQSGRHPPAHRVPFDVKQRVQTHHFARASPGAYRRADSGYRHLDLERLDRQR